MTTFGSQDFYPERQNYHSPDMLNNSTGEMGLGASGDNTGTTNVQREYNNAEHIPRTKRIACVICRKRKLKCDGKRPSCGTCSRLKHDCAYDEVRKKSGPKRGYVKQLEARLGEYINS